MTKATITPTGQIAIPKSIRDRLSLQPGVQVVLDVQGEQIVIKRHSPDMPHWRTMRGMFKDAGNLLADLASERAEELSRDRQKAE